MRFVKTASVCLLSMFLTGNPVSARQAPSPAAPKSAPTEEEKKKLLEKAGALLEETFSETQSLTIPNNRVVLIGEMLPCLWKHDPAKAREAAGTLISTIASQESQPTTSDEDDFEGQSVGFRGRADGNFRLYLQTISKIGNADAQTALELLTATRGTMTATRPDRSKSLDELARSLEITAAGKNPEKLYEIAKRNLEKGEIRGAVALVPRIAERDAALAGKLFGEIVPKVVAMPDDTPEKIARFIQLAELLPKEKVNEPPKGGPDVPQSRSGMGPKVEENERRVFFLAFGETVLRLFENGEPRERSGTEVVFDLEAASPFNRGQIRPFLPEFQKYAPRVAEQLKKKVSQSEEAVVGDGAWEKDILKRLEERKLSEEEMDFVTQGLFPRYLMEGKVDEARKIIDKVPDPAVRERLTRQLESTEALKTAENDKASEADAARLIEQAKTGGQRFRLLLAFAEKAVARKDEKRATELLDQALTLTGSIQNPRVQITSRMAVAAVFVKFAPGRALDIYEPLVDKLNEFLGGAAIIGSYLNLGGIEPVRGNEFNLESSGGVGELVPTNLIPLGLIAKADFDRTRALIDRVRFPEIRARLRMEILKAVLLPEEPPTETPADAPTTAEKKPETAP